MFCRGQEISCLKCWNGFQVAYEMTQFTWQLHLSGEFNAKLLFHLVAYFFSYVKINWHLPLFHVTRLPAVKSVMEAFCLTFVVENASNMRQSFAPQATSEVGSMLNSAVRFIYHDYIFKILIVFLIDHSWEYEFILYNKVNLSTFWPIKVPNIRQLTYSVAKIS